MINEGRGINNKNKDYIDKIFHLFIKNGYGRHITNLFEQNIIINFIKNDNYDSSFYSSNKNLELSFNLPVDYKEVEFKQIISHELNHLVEILNIHIKKYRYPKYNLIKKSLLEYNPKSIFGEFFKHLIYKTLDNEINAVVAQTYSYLKSFNSYDEIFLKSKLEEYSKTIEYKKIKNINLNKFISDAILNSSELKELNKLFLKYNVDGFYNFIVEIDNTSKWIKNWYKIIQSNCDKLLKKQPKLIKEILEEEEYETGGVDEKTVKTFNEYLNNYKNKKK